MQNTQVTQDTQNERNIIEYKQVSIENMRWIIYLKNGDTIVENHQFHRTWKKCYHENFKNIESICFQLIPDGIKYFVDPSNLEEYWIFEEFVCQFGGTPQHINRNLASRIDENSWSVLSIDGDKEVTRSIMSTEEIGYNTSYFLEDK